MVRMTVAFSLPWRRILRCLLLLACAGAAAAGSFRPIVAVGLNSSPGPPQNVRAIPDAHCRLNVLWDPPATDGGLPISDYGVTPIVNSVSQSETVTADSSTSYNQGMDHTSAYQFTVVAYNSAGRGTSSAVSRSVTDTTKLPGVVSGLTSQMQGVSDAYLQWTYPSNAGYVGGFWVTPYRNGSAEPARYIYPASCLSPSLVFVGQVQQQESARDHRG